MLAPECFSHDHGICSETSTQAFNQYGSLENSQLMYHSQVYSTKHSVLSCAGSYQMPDLNSAAAKYTHTSQHSVPQTLLKQALAIESVPTSTLQQALETLGPLMYLVCN